MVQAKHMHLKNMPGKAMTRPAAGLRSQSDEDKDAAVVSIIRGISLLIAHARRSELGKATQVLSHAKEDLVYWAVDQNFHETADDRFINRHVHGVNAEIGNELLHCIANLDASPTPFDIAGELNMLVTRLADLAARSSAIAASKKDYD